MNLIAERVRPFVERELELQPVAGAGWSWREADPCGWFEEGRVPPRLRLRLDGLWGSPLHPRGPPTGGHGRVLAGPPPFAGLLAWFAVHGERPLDFEACVGLHRVAFCAGPTDHPWDAFLFQGYALIGAPGFAEPELL